MKSDGFYFVALIAIFFALCLIAYDLGRISLALDRIAPPR